MRLVKLPLFAILVLAALPACARAPIPDADAPRHVVDAPTRAAPAVTSISLPTFAPGAKPKILRINLGARPENLDPQRASARAEFAILQLAYEGLTRVDEKGAVLPGAAERWEFGNDGKTLTFYLRKNLKRTDGAALTAKDFEYVLTRLVDPRVGAPYQSFLDDVRGALTASSLDPKSKPEEIVRVLNNVGVKATDDTTLVVTFDQPAGYWVTLAATGIAFPVDKGKLDKEPDAWWLAPENHNGNGAFRIAEIRDEVIRLIPNPNYWGGKPKMDRIEFSWIADAGVLASYRKGEIDLVRLTAENFALVQNDAVLSKEMFRTSAARVTYLGFNLKRAPFTDKNVRKAFSLALDREGLARAGSQGLGKPYLSWIPPGVPGYDESATVPGYNAPAARQTLIDAGYGTPDKKNVDCAKLGAIKLTFANAPRTQAAFQFIAENLTRVFACPITLDPVEANAYSVVVRDPRTTPQVFLIAWEQEYAHPQNWLFLQACSGVFAQRLGYCDREYDAALAAANQELEWQRAMVKYQIAQKIFIGDLTAAFLWQSDNAFLVKPSVRGVREHSGAGDNVWVGQFGPVLLYDVE
jgi:oligopeptide transport system substrate-binding protein